MLVSTLLLACGGGDGGSDSGSGTTSPGQGQGTGQGQGQGQAGATTTTVALASRVEQFPVQGRNHVPGRVEYPQTPPVGGDHNPVWMNCGFYSQPVVTEAAVHSMEHGAVWITFRPALPRAQVDRIRSLARSTTYVLASPWSDDSLPAPVVASAWGLQLKMQSADDPGLEAFVKMYANGPQTPEKGAPCSGAFGDPE